MTTTAEKAMAPEVERVGGQPTVAEAAGTTASTENTPDSGVRAAGPTHNPGATHNPSVGEGAGATEKASVDKAPAPDKRKALGRGLESLLPGGPRPLSGSGLGVAPRGAMGPAGGGVTAVASPAAAGGVSAVISELRAQAAARRVDGHEVIDLPLEKIDTNPYQTRSYISETGLKELAESIKANGVIQPIVVRPGKEGRYLLIIGERRTRAAKVAGKEMVPAIVRHVSDQQAAEMTIIENLQRQDLNCLDQAYAFAQLSQEFKLTQEQIGQRTGCSRESVSNYMRLLKLPHKVQQYLREGELGFSEARVLLTLLNPDLIPKLAEEAVKKHLSVDQLEDLVFAADMPLEKRPPQHRGARWVDPNVKEAQRELEKVLGCRVRIRDRRGKGKIIIEYAKLEDFDRVVDILKGKSGS